VKKPTHFALVILSVFLIVSLYHGIHQQKRANANYQYAKDLRQEVDQLNAQIKQLKDEIQQERKITAIQQEINEVQSDLLERNNKALKDK
jgi:peptidoglycan hydrolase CwlO-like protein